MVRTHFLLALLVASVSVAAVASSSDATAHKAPPAQAIGVLLNSGPNGEDEAFELFLSAGASAFEAPQPWSTLEPAKRRYHLGDVSAIVRGLASIPKTQIMIIPAAIETTRRSVPADLRRAPWDSRRMTTRYRALIKRLARHLSPQVRYVSIANEADVYLSAHPGQLPSFVRFARKEIATLHRLAPKVKAGVTVTYGGLTSTAPRVAKALARLGDATFATYYPLVHGYQMASPRAPLHDIPQLVQFAHGRPLVLQEAGYSSSSRLGSSPAAQATFVRNVLSASSRSAAAIPFLSFYTLFDEPKSQCTDHSDAVTFFCSLGLRRSDGRAKPAWSAFRKGIKAAGG